MMLANVVTVTQNTKNTQYYQLLVHRPSIIKSPHMAFISTFQTLLSQEPYVYLGVYLVVFFQTYIDFQ